MIQAKFSHIGLTCNDPIIIENFYTRYFGFKRKDVFASGSSEIIMLSAGEMGLELFKSSEPEPYPKPGKDGYGFSGWRHICFQIDNIDDKLKEFGNDLKVTHGPVTLSNMILCWISDPEGNIVELCQMN